MKARGKSVSSRRKMRVSPPPHPKPSPRGEGAPKGRIGHWRYESERGKRLKQAENENTAFPVSSFRAKREIFLAHWSDKRCGRAVNTVLHRTWNDGLPHMYCFPACKKDPSAALGMTKREDGLSHFSSHPAAGANLRPFGAPPSKGRREKSKILFPCALVNKNWTRN